MIKRKDRTLHVVHELDTEMEGPFQCPFCGGHMKIDATYADQVSSGINCPYCYKRVYAPEIYMKETE